MADGEWVAARRRWSYHDKDTGRVLGLIEYSLMKDLHHAATLRRDIGDFVSLEFAQRAVEVGVIEDEHAAAQAVANQASIANA